MDCIKPFSYVRLVVIVSGCLPVTIANVPDELISLYTRRFVACMNVVFPLHAVTPLLPPFVSSHSSVLLIHVLVISRKCICLFDDSPNNFCCDVASGILVKTDRYLFYIR
jgi:hypothetical protein